MNVRTIVARYAGVCGDCKDPIAVGDVILYGGRGKVAHEGCDLGNVEAGPTTRERKAARVERLRGWADGREAKAEAAFAGADRIADMIPMGQPILVGHHSEGRHRRDLDRIDRGMRAGIDHGRKAERMAEKATNIERAAAAAIYSDDPDAVEQLEAKLAGLEAERARWKAYNAACRKAKGCTAEALALLDARQRADIASTARTCSSFMGRYGQAPSYHVSNLSGNISRLRARLANLKRG